MYSLCLDNICREYLSYPCSFIFRISIANHHSRNNHIISDIVTFTLLLLIIISSLITLFSIVEKVGASLEETKEFQFFTYYDPIYGIKIQYPSNWIVDKKETLMYNDITKIVGFIKDPNSLNGDFLISTYNLTNYEDSQTTSLDELLNDNIDYYKEHYDDFNLIVSNTNLILAGTGSSAYKLVWIDMAGQYTIKTMQLGTIMGNKVYVIQYYAELGEFRDNLPTIQKMIDSLKINSNTANQYVVR